MALTKDQKDLVTKWVAAGLKDREIVRLAKEQTPPFHISQQSISKTYRKKVDRGIQRAAAQKRDDQVLRDGLAAKEGRIRMLEDMANYMFQQAKAIPVSRANQLPGYVNAMRGCLDDIAKELGQRSSKVDVNADVRVRDIVAIVKKIYGE